MCRAAATRRLPQGRHRGETLKQPQKMDFHSLDFLAQNDVAPSDLFGFGSYKATFSGKSEVSNDKIQVSDTNSNEEDGKNTQELVKFKQDVNPTHAIAHNVLLVVKRPISVGTLYIDSSHPGWLYWKGTLPSSTEIVCLGWENVTVEANYFRINDIVFQVKNAPSLFPSKNIPSTPKNILATPLSKRSMPLVKLSNPRQSVTTPFKAKTNQTNQINQTMVTQTEQQQKKHYNEMLLLAKQRRDALIKEANEEYQFEKLRLDSELQNALSKTATKKMECQLCFDASVTIKLHPCKHEICSSCLSEWSKTSSTCPWDRQVINSTTPVVQTKLA